MTIALPTITSSTISSTTISSATTSTNSIPLSSSAVERGVDFILSHFPEPIWPRTISTKSTEGKQILVFNIREALARFRQANFLDCRINAYPDHTSYKEINRQAPNFIMIDLDLEHFKSRKALDQSLKGAIRKTKETFAEGAEPTIIWTGNGYHIYQPIEAFVLEQVETFSKFDMASGEFLRFAERYISNGESDSVHNATVSFKNCMLRIPGSYNSKHYREGSVEVKVIQKWNGRRPKIKLLLGSFYAYLIDKKIKQLSERETKSKKSWYKHASSSLTGGANTIPWIEKLLQTPIHDHRKFSVWRILASYLTNVRKLPYDDGSYVIRDWLDRCNNLRRLDFRPDYYIRYNLSISSKKGYLPISVNRLKDENKKLYDILLG